jgi:hypothetical protein
MMLSALAVFAFVAYRVRKNQLRTPGLQNSALGLDWRRKRNGIAVYLGKAASAVIIGAIAFFGVAPRQDLQHGRPCSRARDRGSFRNLSGLRKLQV